MKLSNAVIFTTAGIVVLFYVLVSLFKVARDRPTDLRVLEVKKAEYQQVVTIADPGRALPEAIEIRVVLDTSVCETHAEIFAAVAPDALSPRRQRLSFMCQAEDPGPDRDEKPRQKIRQMVYRWSPHPVGLAKKKAADKQIATHQLEIGPHHNSQGVLQNLEVLAQVEGYIKEEKAGWWTTFASYSGVKIRYQALPEGPQLPKDENL